MTSAGSRVAGEPERTSTAPRVSEPSASLGATSTSAIAGLPMNPATNVLAGRCVDRVGIADLLEPPLAHHRDPVAHRHRLDLVVGDVDGRRADLRCSRRISPRVCARSFASRFESGSSIRNTCGSRTSARPSATRCRWPPESSRGLRSRSSADARGSRPPRSTRRARSRPRGTLAHLEPEREVLADAHLRVERVVLEDHRDVAPRGATSSTTASPIRMCPPVSASSPASSRSAVVLPEPDGPTSTMNSPSAISSESSSTADVVAEALRQRSRLDRSTGRPCRSPLHRSRRACRG